MRVGYKLMASVSFLVVALSSLAGCVFIRDNNSLIDEAQALEQQGKSEKAIQKYIEHIELRLAEPKRPSWENPYFYFLLIGDVYLKDGDVEKALGAYETAEENKVESVLVTDRYRSVANWYHQRGQSDQALKILEKYRDRDPLLFDAMLDRIAREIVRREELNNSTGK